MHIKFLNDAQNAVVDAALKNAGHDLVTFGLNELDHAIVAAKKTEIGAAAVAAIAAAENPNLSSIQKLEQAMATVVPVVIDYAAKGGVTALVSDAEVFAKGVIESTLADTKKTGALQIATAVLSLVHPTTTSPAAYDR